MPKQSLLKESGFSFMNAQCCARSYDWLSRAKLIFDGVVVVVVVISESI